MSSTTYNITPGRYDRELPVSTKTHFISSAASTNATVVKAAPGTLFNLIIHNTTGANKPHYLRLYNKSTVPIVGTDVPMAVIQIIHATSKEISFSSGITFTQGIAYSITDSPSLLDATPVTANAIQLYMGYM